MTEKDPRLEKLRKICLALPETKETITWGHPNFRVGEKIFASYYRDGKSSTIGFKTDKLVQEQLVKDDERFEVAPYVGQHGWVSMTLSGKIDWKEIAEFVKGSYGLIAPRKLAKLVV